jgi:hypothetical protein
MIVACQWNKSSPVGPALHDVGGSFCKSMNSFWILLLAISGGKVKLARINLSAALVDQLLQRLTKGDGI